MRTLVQRRIAVAVTLAAIVACGAYLRLAGVRQRPFWRDEACVAEIIRDLPLAALPFQSGLAAPPLHVLLVKLAGGIAAPAEFTYRLPTVVWGILTIPLAYGLLRAARMARFAALGCTAALTLSLPMVIWSRELRQYA